MWVDTHCHLAGKEYDLDRDEVFKRAHEAGVDLWIVIGAGDGVDENEKALEVANQEKNVFVALGVHPHDASKVDHQGNYLLKLKAWSKHPKVVALGEMGLDYHYDHSPRETQKRRFAEQIALAQELNLPIIIHTREAWKDTIAILEESGIPSRGGVFHCFSESIERAHQVIELGFYISISGIVTFKKAEKLVEVVSQIPLEKILIETDAPFLAPVPYRGKRNEPAFVAKVGEKIAEIKGISVEEVAQKTSDNARRLFRL